MLIAKWKFPLPSLPCLPILFCLLVSPSIYYFSMWKCLKYLLVPALLWVFCVDILIQNCYFCSRGAVIFKWGLSVSWIILSEIRLSWHHSFPAKIAENKGSPPLGGRCSSGGEVAPPHGADCSIPRGGWEAQPSPNRTATPSPGGRGKSVWLVARQTDRWMDMHICMLTQATCTLMWPLVSIWKKLGFVIRI